MSSFIRRMICLARSLRKKSRSGHLRVTQTDTKMDINGTNWQTTLGNCREKLKYILDTAALADVVFVIGEEREIVRAHSLILRLNSPVFDVMLSGRWGTLPVPLPVQVTTPRLEKEKQSEHIGELAGASSTASSSASSSQEIDPTRRRKRSAGTSEGSPDECPQCKHQSYIPQRFRHNPYHGDGDGDGDNGDQNFKNIIELPHLEPVSFRLFLTYIYTDDFDIPLEYTLFVWHLAEFYNVPTLTEKCETYVTDSLEKENALMIYQHAQTVHHVRIAEMSFQYVLFNAREIFLSESFLSLTKQNLINLLKDDRLDIEEASLFAGVYLWAQTECSRQELLDTPENIRLVLGEGFHLIRFPLIPAHRFTMDVVPKNLLSDTELITLYKYITLPSLERQNREIDTFNFSKTPRRPVYHLSRFNPHHTSPYRIFEYDGEGRQFCFTIDHEISLVGVGMFASAASGLGSFEIEVKLKNHEDRVLTVVEKTMPTSKIKQSIVPVLFASPVELERGSYHIHYKVKGPLTYYNTGHLSKTVSVTSGTVSVTFKFSNNQLCDLLDTSEINPRAIPIPEIYFVF